MSSDVQSCLDALKQRLPAPGSEVVEALAPSGVLRAGINLSNFLLVTDQKETGEPVGASPGMALALGTMIGCDVEMITFPSPGAVADAAQQKTWDIGNIGADPARAEFIDFTGAYCEIESTCLVPSGSPITAFEQVDQPGITIATKKRAAYTLWLERNLKNAELVQFDSTESAFEGFVEQKLDVLAGLRPRLIDDSELAPGSMVLKDRFAAVQQAIGTPSDRPSAGIQYLEQFVAGAKETGLVQALIDQHGVNGKLSVAR